MTEMQAIADEAEMFVQRARAVTLDTLLDEAPDVQHEFDQLKIRMEAVKGFWIGMNGWEKMSKPELVELATERNCVFKAAESKSGLLALVVQAHWSELDASKAYERARNEADRIRQWAKRLSEVPELLQELVDEAERFYTERWIKSQSQGIHEAANGVRMHVLTLLEWEWAASRAKRALNEWREGRTSLANLVLRLAHEVEMAIMGIIPTNVSASGVGVEHMAHVGGAKLLTRTYHRAVSEESRKFLSTVYH
jgi:hypothetical protein